MLKKIPFAVILSLSATLFSSVLLAQENLNINLETFYDGNKIEILTGCSYEKTPNGYYLGSNCGYKSKNKEDLKIVFKSVVTKNMLKGIDEDSQKKSLQDFHAIFPVAMGLYKLFEDYKFSTASSGKPIFENSETLIDDEAKTIKPPKKIAGDIARSYFHLEQHYGVKIENHRDKKVYELWRTADPVEEFEFAKNRFIKEKIGKSNDFISTHSN